MPIICLQCHKLFLIQGHHPPFLPDPSPPSSLSIQRSASYQLLATLPTPHKTRYTHAHAVLIALSPNVTHTQSQMHIHSTHKRACIHNHKQIRVSTCAHTQSRHSTGVERRTTRECGCAMRRGSNCSHIHIPARGRRIVSTARLQPLMLRAHAHRVRRSRVEAAISRR